MHLAFERRQHHVERLGVTHSQSRKMVLFRLRERHTCNGQISDQFIRVGSTEPVNKLDIGKFFANDGSDINRLVSVKDTLELQWFGTIYSAGISILLKLFAQAAGLGDRGLSSHSVGGKDLISSRKEEKENCFRHNEQKEGWNIHEYSRLHKTALVCFGNPTSMAYFGTRMSPSTTLDLCH